MNHSHTGDPIVDEVYAIRAEIAAECGFDIQRIAEHATAAAAAIPGLKYVSIEEMRERRRQREAAASMAAT